jgi:hypothetical protein
VPPPDRAALGRGSGIWPSDKTATLIEKNFETSLASSSPRQDSEDDMDIIKIGNTGIVTSRIALGTWAIGGWMWGGTDSRDALGTIRRPSTAASQ